MAPVGTISALADPKSRRKRWSWVGGLTLIIVNWQLVVATYLFQVTIFGHDYGSTLASLPILFLVGLLAPLVSYRRRDALLVIVPIYNLVVLWRIGSRLVRLPDRDWPQRPDEIGRRQNTSPEGIRA
jgi:hypothetical protein